MGSQAHPRVSELASRGAWPVFARLCRATVILPCYSDWLSIESFFAFVNNCVRIIRSFGIPDQTPEMLFPSRSVIYVTFLVDGTRLGLPRLLLFFPSCLEMTDFGRWSVNPIFHLM